MSRKRRMLRMGMTEAWTVFAQRSHPEDGLAVNRAETPESDVQATELREKQ